MKKSLVLFAALFAFVISCKKKDSKQGFTYAVNNVSDITITRDTTIYLPIQIALLTGEQETVTASIGGLPTGVTATPVSASGVPTYTQTFTLTSSNAPVGTHEISVTTSSKSTTAKTFKFNLTINPRANCAAYLAGHYTGISACFSGSFGSSPTAVITAHPDTLLLNGFAGGNLRVYVNCATNTLTIPLQTVGSGNKLSATGTFTNNSLTINSKLFTASGTFLDSCQTGLGR